MICHGTIDITAGAEEHSVVTDEEYKALKTKVNELEKKINLLAQQYSSLYMRSDIRNISGIEAEKRTKHRDVTKFEFEGTKYNKRQLVLACVKKYVEENRITRSEDLFEAFPDYIQGSLGIVKRVEEAEKYSNANKRFYFLDSDIIRLVDGNYAVCSQWDAGNIDRFIKLVEDIGYEVVRINRKNY